MHKAHKQRHLCFLLCKTGWAVGTWLCLLLLFYSSHTNIALRVLEYAHERAGWRLKTHLGERERSVWSISLSRNENEEHNWDGVRARQGWERSTFSGRPHIEIHYLKIAKKTVCSPFLQYRQAQNRGFLPTALGQKIDIVQVKQLLGLYHLSL